MFVKLIHGDQFSQFEEGSSVKSFFTIFANISRAEYIETRELGHVLYMWAYGDPVIGFLTYHLDGNVGTGCRKTETVYFLNDEGKTIDRYYPNPKTNGIREKN